MFLVSDCTVPAINTKNQKTNTITSKRRTKKTRKKKETKRWGNWERREWLTGKKS